ncbi:MAG: MMPL family transporter [Ignavibacteriaceae bacterium]|nr:MMPL family transporter [Ignavibacteriaceae bacterium]
MKNKTTQLKFFLEPFLSRLNRNKKIILVIIFVICLTALSLNSLLDLKVNPKWSNALPQKDTLVSEYLSLVEDTLRGSVVYALVEGPEKEKIADEFSHSVIKQPDIRFVFDGRIKLSETGSSIYALDKKSLLKHLEITKNINIDQLVNLFKEKLKDYITISSIFPETTAPTNNWNQFLIALELALQKKPLNNLNDLIDDMFFTQGNRIYSKDNKSLLILIGTDISEGSIEKIDALCDSLNSIKNKILNRPSQSEIKLTGYPITARDEMQSISASGKKMTVWALIIVTVALIFFYKEWKFVAASMGILCIGIMWTLALNQKLFGELNTVTLIMGLILIGLGIDFSIHWINYKITNSDYVKEESQIAKKYWHSTATPILAGAFTTATSFLALLILNVKSINEFGIMSFIGIMLVAVLILLLMPIIITEFKDSSAYSDLRIKIQKSVLTVINHQKKILLLGVLMIACCLWFLPQLKYEYNYAKLQIGNLPSYEIKNEMNNKFGFASDVFLYRTTGIESDKDIKRKLEVSDKIGYVLSISDYIPINEKLSNNNIVREITTATRLIKINELSFNKLKLLRNDFEEISYLLSFIQADSSNITEILSILKRVVELLNVTKLKSLNDFNRIWVESFINSTQIYTANNQPEIENLSKKIRYLFGTSKPDEFVQYIYPVNDTWEKENIESLEPILCEVAPNAVGLSRISYHISNWIVDEVITISIASLLVILVTLLVTQKNLKFAAIAILPLSLGVLFTLSTLSLLNIKVSFYNLIGLPIILGIGIDNGIHVVHACRENFENVNQKAFLKVGPALFLTAITSMIGFGFLSFYSHPGISSLGVVAFIGIGWCFITTIIFLPIVINHFYKNYTNR